MAFALFGCFAVYGSHLLIAGIGFIAFGALLFSAMIAQMIWLRALRLTAVGFDLIGPLRTFSRSWNEIAHFHLRKRARAPTSAAYTRNGSPQSAFQNFNRSAAGADGIFAKVFDLSPEELVTLLEKARVRWSSHDTETDRSTAS